MSRFVQYICRSDAEQTVEAEGERRYYVEVHLRHALKMETSFILVDPEHPPMNRVG